MSLFLIYGLMAVIPGLILLLIGIFGADADVDADIDIDADIGRVAQRVNRLVCKNTDNSQFVTCFMGILNTETHELEYVNAGHELPHVYSADGSMRTLETSRAIPIVVVTAKDLTEADFEFLRQRVDKIIRKSGLDRERLVGEVRNLLKEHTQSGKEGQPS